MRCLIKAIFFSLAIATPASIAGCGQVEHEYRWTRQEPAIGRQSGTEFAVRLRIDEQRSEVVWMERAWDNEGEISVDISTYDSCKVLDEDNWECGPYPLLDVRIVMADGQLTMDYWGEKRVFESRYRLFGTAL